MKEMAYSNFDLLIEKVGSKYQARILEAPTGQASVQFSLPFSNLELENFFLRIGRPRRGVRRLESPEMDAAHQFGVRLFDAVFGDEVYTCFRTSLNEAASQGKGLRLRLRIDAVDLADLPWEFVFSRSLNRFLAWSIETPIVRFIELAQAIPVLKVDPPLRMLVMISSPSDVPALDVEQEWLKVTSALKPLVDAGKIVVERLEEATLIALQQHLRSGEYHIFHFIGHGGFDFQAQEGALILEDENGRGRQVSGQHLGMLMHDHKSLRLAVLNSCEGARTSKTDPLAGVAQSLVQQGIPAVIAMQFEITDEAALTFAQEFYTAVVEGYPVDAALAETRKAIFATGNDIEWGTPVLFTRAPDGRIFDVSKVALSQPVPQRISPPPDLHVEKKGLAEPLPLAQTSPAQAQRAVKTKVPAWSWIVGGLVLVVGIILGFYLLNSNPARQAGMVNSPMPAVFDTLQPSTASVPTPTLLPTQTLLSAANPTESPTSTSLPAQSPTSLPAQSPTSASETTYTIGSQKTSAKDGMVQLFVPAGEFTMGSDLSDNIADADERPQHQVNLNAFWIDKNEVTNGMYALCVNDNACNGPVQRSSFTRDSYFDNPQYRDFPVIYINWEDAVTYCGWAGRRLPTEAEWEKAARGTDQRTFPWGDKISCNVANYKNCVEDTARVGKFTNAKSPYGALDMAGNVWEWTSTLYMNYPYDPNDGREEPTGGDKRVLRGGSWGDASWGLRTAFRGVDLTPEHLDLIGFRCAE